MRALSSIQDLALFNRFITFIAGRSGRTINYSEIGKDIGTSYKTAQHYLSILEASYLWRPLPSFHLGSIEKRLAKAPKGVIMDSGLLCFLIGVFSLDALERTPLLGSIFESFVINELLRLACSLGLPLQCSSFRTRGGSEVDLVIDYDGRTIPVEIKYGASPKADWTRGIQTIRRLKGLETATGYVISLNKEIFELNRGIWNIPLSRLWAL